MSNSFHVLKLHFLTFGSEKYMIKLTN